MTTTPSPSRGRQTPPPGRSIGRFLCLHPTTPPVENVDQLPLLDIRQDAALRAWIALAKLGLDNPDDPIAAFDAAPALAALAYRWAYADALKKRLGRGARRRRRASTAQSWDDLAHPLGSLLLSTLAARLPTLGDPAQEAALTAVQDDAPGDIVRLWRHGFPGVSVPRSRRILRLMRLAQIIRDHGAGRVPNRLHQELYRLRKETGLPLRLDLL